MSIREKFLETALSQIGVPYHYQANDGRYLDCVGLISYSFKLMGYDLDYDKKYNLPQHYAINETLGKYFEASPRTLTGDLITFYDTNTQLVNHVGIYLSDTDILHSINTGKTHCVKIDHNFGRFWSKRVSCVFDLDSFTY